MFNQSNIESYIANCDAHKDYYTVMEQYYGTVIFEEIIHFMNIKFPNWKSNRGIGFWSAEFVLTLIQNNEYLLDRTEYSFRVMLEILYLEIDNQYTQTKSSFDIIYVDKVFKDFEIKHQEELEEMNDLNEYEYFEIYDDLFDNFKKKHIEIVTYTFEGNKII